MTVRILFPLMLICNILLADEAQVNMIQHDAKYGLFGQVNYNNYNSNFSKLPEIPNCCPKFTTGGGFGYKVGVLFEIDKSMWSLRAGINDLSGNFLYTEITNVIPNGTSVVGEFEHTIEADLKSIFLSPQFSYYIDDNLIFYIGLNLEYLFIADFYQKEQISKPIGKGTFLDSLGNDTYSRIRNEFEGNIPKINSFQLGFTSGLSYQLPMNNSNSLFLVPEAFFSYGLNNVVQGIDWKINTISLGLAIKYKRPPEPIYIDEYEEEIKIDTLILVDNNIDKQFVKFGIASSTENIQKIDYKKITTKIISRTDTLFLPRKYSLTADITAIGIDTTGNEISNPKIIIEEFVAKRLDPLLNYIFFDDNSNIVSVKYKKLTNSEIASFSEDKLYEDSTLGIYYNLLNIVGYRMKKYPQANLTITGCNSNYGGEKGNVELSQKRAENIKNYLAENWLINQNRIIIQSRNLPQKASLPFDEPDKIAENRRVELISDNYEILKPVFTTDTAVFCNLDKIELIPDINSEAGLKDYQIKMYLDNQIELLDESKTVVENTEYYLKSDLKKLKKSGNSIKFKLNANDIKNQRVSSLIKEIPVEFISLEKKSQSNAKDYEINKFSLILFEFDRSDIAGNNKTIIDFIKNIVKTDSEIEITGFTDRTGNDDYNLKLSERRAVATKSILNNSNANARGAGETVLIYNNDIPEGRFYCRTVEILVKTRIK